MTTQAIIYTRFSPRPDADESKSSEKQEARCREYCARKSYTVEAVHDDPDTSGGLLDRPGLAEAISSLRPGYVLVVDSGDRLARDLLVDLTIRQQVADAGARIECANGSTMPDTPEGRLVRNVLAAFAAYERDRTRARTKNALDRKRAKGKRITGRIPIGWEHDPERPKYLRRCKRERDAILKAHWLARLRSKTSSEIARALDEEFGPCRGRPWSARTVRKLLADHAYWADPLDGDLTREPKHP